ncbi:hypothetical protein Tco_1347845, partial [Tanacetum coccineum]
KSVHAKEPIHTVENSRVQRDQEFVTGDNDEQPADKEVTKADCQVARAEEPPTSFDEVMDTSFDFSAFVINWLNIKDLTQEILIGPAFELLKGTCKSLTELEYHLEECSKATTEQLDWHNPEDKPLKFAEMISSCTHSKKVIYYDFAYKILKICYYFLFNRSRPISRSDEDPHGMIYVDQFDRIRLMRTDELHKFSDGTPNDVSSALHDIASGIRMKYLPKRKWSNSDKRRARVMVQDIDKQLFERRLMRNLEKFIGGREYGNDLRLLERTI